MRFFLVFAMTLFFASNGGSATYRILQAYPHDEHAFTQGLLYIDGHLYESTGIQGQSTLREEDLETGRILRMQLVSDQYFAEGLTDWKNTLVQLTWKSHIGLVYDRATFQLLRTFRYEGEGWGLTHDAKSLILSDGTADLRFFDPDTFKQVRRITVKDHGKLVTKLNELEFIHGEIYANVWYSDRIARISPANGRVLGWIDLKGLTPRDQLSSDQAVLNGIAYDSQHDRLFVTGKLWPKVFEIAVTSNTSASARHRK
ncbi:glutaminyl-peptide cyclotransferase [Occallatibacter savannae]|uniref:glutaminyl-peptide cyclotransferase n=1 Tax=Occallatibacter savannae TaxID=1002691 RepID=UPI001EF47691|nr:glutaminyl-peptide cyclotransferase [Occallatibacter savannae]